MLISIEKPLKRPFCERRFFQLDTRLLLATSTRHQLVTFCSLRNLGSSIDVRRRRPTSTRLVVAGSADEAADASGA